MEIEGMTLEELAQAAEEQPQTPEEPKPKANRVKVIRKKIPFRGWEANRAHRDYPCIVCQRAIPKGTVYSYGGPLHGKAHTECATIQTNYLDNIDAENDAEREAKAKMLLAQREKEGLAGSIGVLQRQIDILRNQIGHINAHLGIED